ncbi:hypothetical protein COO60DRAFT_1500853 [Scenedesmus sp. NREL 46B-D3]|nr:hypothetical protein COO60DRAFT_1500853 [Scenedesmus sp. NREL 46B-D3]
MHAEAFYMMLVFFLCKWLSNATAQMKSRSNLAKWQMQQLDTAARQYPKGCQEMLCRACKPLLDAVVATVSTADRIVPSITPTCYYYLKTGQHHHHCYDHVAGSLCQELQLRSVT